MKRNVFFGPVAEATTEPSQSVKPKIVDSRHPTYSANTEWRKWRLTYASGRPFINEYLRKFSTRESPDDFEARKAVTPVPAFAKSTINDIKNSIFQRMADTTRRGGSISYQESVIGNKGGVDRRGGSMNWFIGSQILPELLVMTKVGVFIDSPPKTQDNQLDRLNKHPYLYRYKVEDILNWRYKEDGSRLELEAVLLRDYVEGSDPETGLPTKVTERFRLMWIDPKDRRVHVKFLDKEDKMIGSEIILQIPKIPFVIFELTDSLLTDAADYQIALLNLRSSDIGFALLSNFPFYTEQRNVSTEDLFAKRPQPPNQTYVFTPGDPTTLVQADPLAACAPRPALNGPEITVGSMHGRMYPTGADRPEFIHPSPEPLKASMELQEALKNDIRLLVNLALSNIKPQNASAESKAMDQVGLESGLSYIGLELEHGERLIADIWGLYEKEASATVKYPERYSLKTDEEQRKEALALSDLQFKAASPLYQKEVAKRIVIILLGSKVSAELLEKILNQIDEAPASTADPDILEAHAKNGWVGNATASEISGYKPGEVAKATEDHIQRLIRIAKAQTPQDGAARGIRDLGVDPDASVKEKQDKPTRGPNDQLPVNSGD